MNDRIKLCEAMGDAIRWRNGYPFRSGSTVEFDPLEDANDDVAVNEWAVKNLDTDAYFAALSEVVGSYCYLHEYRIGYFARAALKVLP